MQQSFDMGSHLVSHSGKDIINIGSALRKHEDDGKESDSQQLGKSQKDKALFNEA